MLRRDKHHINPSVAGAAHVHGRGVPPLHVVANEESGLAGGRLCIRNRISRAS